MTAIANITATSSDFSVADYDVIVIGSGVGGLVTATQLAAKGIKVLVLEKYLIPGGSAGYFEREGYRFDVGASMIFGFGEQGTTNLLTRALDAVGMKINTIPDPVQIHYHLPNDLSIRVHRDYEEFLQELIARFPHEEKGIRKFYGECWDVFNCLNSMELLSLEEIKYLLRVFVQEPLSCLGLLKYLPQNAGDIARHHIKDKELLKFIDMECYCWSVVPAELTPMINAGMVFSDRHYGGINYPEGGVGQIPLKLVEGLKNHGGDIEYSANVYKILTEKGKAVGVKLVNGKEFRARKIISNATRWDTFEKLLPAETKPKFEKKWEQNYKKSPSFLSLHLGVKADLLAEDADCHHIFLEDWNNMEDEQGTIFVSIPTLLDPSLAPEGHHIIHTFTPSFIDEWKGLSPKEYEEKKDDAANHLIQRLETIFPGITEKLDYMEVGTPRTHRKFLGRVDGSYGPIPQKKLLGLLGMFNLNNLWPKVNKTEVDGLYCVGDSTFPGQGLNAVAFSGFACAHKVATELGK
ncbi:carotene isomerase [[Leptolyngbya] sp. PCC 7376]|uniref:carotenoid isomerase n=1 Tax=[Leptolyngbya] sp. PCC 7376 TaxID=111781 RepID=UPI00029F227F|nr:carotenoid isomerase [[Leptolyngbya] sp. PCC 7376]AFY36951.1 carotene isomerase [[Leptolyngbya] sp. PCC 7376]